MDEEELIKEAVKLVPEVYKDLAKPAIQEVGSVGGRTAKALLFPIRGLLWGWEKIEEVVMWQPGIDEDSALDGTPADPRFKYMKYNK